MRPIHALFCCVLTATACASHDGQGGDDPVVNATKVELRASIASVQLAQDCPDPPAAEPAAAKQAPAADEPSAGAAMVADGRGWSPPCSQSTVQLTLAHDGTEALPFEIKAMRLTMAGTGGVLATVPFRGPSRWADNGGRYEAWDQKLAPAAEHKVSYKLGEPDWSLVAKTLGTDDTFGKRYVLEVDVVFAGRSITVRSPEFEREYPHVVVT